MIINCPHCHTTFPAESATEDLCARQLFGMAPRLGNAYAPLVAYLGLFKPRSQALRWSRALALAEQVQQLAEGVDNQVLATAMIETVEAKREERQHKSWKPFTNHRYMQKVLESVASRDIPQTITTAGMDGQAKPQSKTAQAINALNTWQGPKDNEIPEWFWRTVADGLADWYLRAMEGAPPADLTLATAERWVKVLWPKRGWNEHSRFQGRQRLHGAFIDSVKGAKRWPCENDLLGFVPKV